jgi:hypothetical protein
LNIIDRLKEVWGWVEHRDLRVGEIWLHPKQVAELAATKDPGWDAIAMLAVREMFLETKGGLYVGMLWGAQVFESGIIVEDHVVALPTGLFVKLIDSSACMRF